MQEIKTNIFSTKSSNLVLSWLTLNANCVILDDDLDSAGFTSILDLKNHYLKQTVRSGNKPNLAKWQRWSPSGSMDGFSGEDILESG